MRSRWMGLAPGVAAATLATAAMLVPTTAQAATGKGAHAHTVVVPRSGPSLGFSLRDHAGFHLEVEADEEGDVALSVSRRGRVNVYFARGAVSADGGIDANFARFGRIAVEFRPSGRPKRERPPPMCHGGPAVTEKGVFVGRIRFHGEGGFTRFTAGRARGEMTVRPRWTCRTGRHQGGRQESEAGEPKPEEGEKGALLSASTPNGSISFGAFGLRFNEFSVSLFFATSLSRYGRISELRRATTVSRSARDFQFDEDLSSATVHPGSPFHGSASFQRGAAGAASTWAGSLRVSFLGGDRALTGGRIEASLSHPKSSGGSFTGSFFGAGRLPRVDRRLLLDTVTRSLAATDR